MRARTRGPYTLDPATPPAIYEERSPAGHIICMFNAKRRSAEENLANAEFFHRAASAHDYMLKAFRTLRLNMEDDIFVDPIKRQMYLSVIDGAIAKAEGK